MANYSLRFKKSVTKDLRRIPEKTLRLILKRFETLKKDPRSPGCEKLSHQERYRIRQGEYRILYEIRDQDLIVMVVKIAHRSEVYRKF